MTAPALASMHQMPGGKHEEVTAMEERSVHTFRNGAETRTLEFGHLLETGETYVRETGRGDITQFCYDALAHDVHLQLVQNPTF